MKHSHYILFTVLFTCFTGIAIGQPNAEVREYEGAPALFINGEPYPPFAYMSYLGEKKYYAEMAAAGLHLYNIPAYLGDRGINSTSGIKAFRPHIWVGENEFDYSGIIKDFDEILSADPGAMVIIRIHLDAPAWWEALHPGTACMLPDGSLYRTSFYSPLWRAEAGRVLTAMVRWLLNSIYAKNLIGVHVAGGFTEEWMYHFRDEFYDENPVRLEGFRQWLQIRYHNNEAALRRAWAQPAVTFETAALGDISGKRRKMEWRNADTAGQVFDTFDFHAETMAYNVAYFCKIVKQASAGKLLTGAFYGYHFFVSDLRRGHGALSTLLRCKDLDYLSSPNDYNRVSGEDWAPFAAIKSVQLHGKLWLAENDTRTAITTMLRDRAPQVAPPGTAYTDGVWLGPKTMEESVAFLKKNLGRMLAYGYGGWWFDMWGGWFSHPQLLDVIKSGQEYFYKYPDKHIPEMDPQVAVLVDEKLGFMDASFGTLTGGILHNRYALGKMGAPYDLYLREDIGEVGKNKYRVIWLLGFLKLKPQEEALIASATRHGAWVMWTDGYHTKVYSPGNETSVAEAPLQWDARALNDLLGKANVHRYLQPGGDVLYAGRGWIAVHSAKGGNQLLRLPFKARIIDPQSGKVIAASNQLKINIPPNSTRLFSIHK